MKRRCGTAMACRNTLSVPVRFQRVYGVVGISMWWWNLPLYPPAAQPMLAFLAKTTVAKSVLDAGRFMLKTQLKYKAITRSVVFAEVNEVYTTQACSCCGSLSASSPKGRAGLGIREWMCADCGTLHDRDVNAARNILAAGHSCLVGGLLVL